MHVRSIRRYTRCVTSDALLILVQSDTDESDGLVDDMLDEISTFDNSSSRSERGLFQNLENEDILSDIATSSINSQCTLILGSVSKYSGHRKRSTSRARLRK